MPPARHPPAPSRHDHARPLPLERQVEYLLEECRIVLPGLQVLFGFQLAVVFSERFARVLSVGQQELHLLAMGLVAVAIAVIMTPAAYHRQAEPQEASEGFVLLSSWLLLASMPLLAVAISLEFYLVAQAVLGSGGRVAAIASGLFAVFVALWLVLPRVACWRKRRQR
ncbi:MAG: DUF6328 family protein [Lysobacteraceae bacterium]